MSRYYFAEGRLECNRDTSDCTIEQIVQLLNEAKGVHRAIVEPAPLETDITFTMDGNNGIDYTPLENLIPRLDKMTSGFTLQTTEYVCAEEGFYHDSDDEEGT